MLADAKRASDFVNWTFGPPSVAPRAPTAAPIRALWPASPSGDNAYPDTHASPWDEAEEPAAPSGSLLGMAGGAQSIRLTTDQSGFMAAAGRNPG
jgi:hypothetical protein